MYDHTLFCVCKSPNQTSGLKWAVISVTADGRLIFFRGLCGYTWIGIYSLYHTQCRENKVYISVKICSGITQIVDWSIRGIYAQVSESMVSVFIYGAFFHKHYTQASPFQALRPRHSGKQKSSKSNIIPWYKEALR